MLGHGYFHEGVAVGSHTSLGEEGRASCSPSKQSPVDLAEHPVALANELAADVSYVNLIR